MKKSKSQFKIQNWFTPHHFPFKESGAGFTALYAVLVASLALAIGLAVANIALKESLLSSTARESQFAFYAADSGIECARFWDKQGVFKDPLGGPIYCNDPLQSSPITVVNNNDDGSDPLNCNPCRFQIAFSPSPESECVNVTVTKNTLGGTTLFARGYNTCNVNDPRRVEVGTGRIY